MGAERGHEPWFAGLREWIAFKAAPWVYVPHREEREEAFRDLAEAAYGSRDAIWTSPRTLVSVALDPSRSIDVLMKKIGDDRIERWSLRRRLDLASARLEDYEARLSRAEGSQQEPS